MHRREATRLILGAGAALALPPAVRAAGLPLPPSMRVRYEVSLQARGFPLSGQGTLAWRHDGQAYEARLELTSLAGTRSQQSSGRLTPQGLAPERYVEHARREEVTTFNRSTGRVGFSGGQPEAALVPGLQDRLSLQFQLGALLAGDEAARRAGHVLEVPVATTHDATAWQFRVEGMEELRLPGGHQTAWRLQRLPRDPADQRLEFWLSPSQAYIPVRLRLTQAGGDWLEQLWSGTDRT